MSTIQTNTVDPTLLATINGSRGAAKTSTEEAQDRFLTLLVAQMKNQDPLNPMDNAQVTSQLAQLSTVTGIEKLNSSVAGLSTNMQASQNLQAANIQNLQATNMIGHGVIAPGSSMGLKDGKAIFGVELPQAAEKVEISIKNESGVTVRILNVEDVPEGVNTMLWNGMSDSGTMMENGSYKFEVKAISAEKKIDSTPLSFGLVSSIVAGPQGAKLSVANIGEISMTDVRQIY